MKKIFVLLATLVLLSACSFNNHKNCDEGRFVIDCNSIVQSINSSRSVVKNPKDTYIIIAEVTGDYEDKKQISVSGADINAHKENTISFEGIPENSVVYVNILVTDEENNIVLKSESHAFIILAGDNSVNINLYGYYLDNDVITLEATDSGILITPKTKPDGLTRYSIIVKKIDKALDLFEACMEYDEDGENTLNYEFVKNDGLYLVQYNMYGKDGEFIDQIWGGIVYAKDGRGELYVTVDESSIDWDAGYIDIYYTVHGACTPSDKQVSVKFTQNDDFLGEGWFPPEIIDEDNDEDPTSHIRIKLSTFGEFAEDVKLDQSKNFIMDVTAQLKFTQNGTNYSTWVMADWLSNNGRFVPPEEFFEEREEQGDEPGDSGVVVVEPGTVVVEPGDFQTGTFSDSPTEYMLTVSGIEPYGVATLVIYKQNIGFADLRDIILSDTVFSKITQTGLKTVTLSLDATTITELGCIENGGVYSSLFTPFTHIYIPTTLTKIYNYTFTNCNKLVEIVTVGNRVSGVTEIGEYAFEGCSSLEDFGFHKLTAIGEYAFKDCENLTGGVLNYKVTIQPTAFSGCNYLNTLVFASDFEKETYESTDDEWTCVVSKISEDTLSVISYNVDDSSFVTFFDTTLPNVTSIIRNIFDNSYRLELIPTNCTFTKVLKKAEDSSYFGNNINSIILPQTVTELESGAFNNCTMLKSIVIPAGVTELPAGLFADCDFDSVYFSDTTSEWIIGSGENTTTFAPNSNPDDKGVSNATIINANNEKVMKKNLLPLYTVTADEAGKIITISDSVTSFQELADILQEDSYMEMIALGYNFTLDLSQTSLDTIKSVGNSSIFTAYKKIIIPYSVTSIDDYAFYNCSNLNQIVVSLNNYYLDKLENIQLINASAFYNCSSLEQILIPNATFISGYAFEGCSGLTYILLSSDVEIMDNAFSPSQSLGTLTFQINSEHFTEYSPMMTFTIHRDALEPYVFASLSTIDFSNNKFNTKMEVISECAKKIRDAEFIESTIPIKFNIASNNTITTIYTKDTNESYFRYFSEITLPDSLVTIGEYAFINCDLLERISIPTSVTSVKEHAFESCPRLSNITFMDTNNWVCTVDGENVNVDVTNAQTNATNLTNSGDLVDKVIFKLTE